MTEQGERERNVMGVVYLIHLDSPIGPEKAPDGHKAWHYIGWAQTGGLDARLDAHRNGKGSKLLAEAARKGISWNVVRTWEGTRDFERLLKRRGSAKRICPCCDPDVAWRMKAGTDKVKPRVAA